MPFTEAPLNSNSDKTFFIKELKVAAQKFEFPSCIFFVKSNSSIYVVTVFNFNFQELFFRENQLLKKLI